MRILKALLFDNHAIRALREYASVYWWIYALLAALLLAVPLTKEEIGTTPFTFALYACVLILFLLVSYWLSKLFKGKSSFTTFVYPLSRILLATAVLVLLLSLASLFLFELVFNVPVVSNLVTSILPFYMIALWAFSAEQLSLVKRAPAAYGIICVIILAVLLFFI